MTLHKTTQLYTYWFRVCPNISSKLLTITLFQSFVKQNNYSNKTCTHVDNLLVTKLCLRATFHELSHGGKRNMNLKFQPATNFVFLIFSTKMVLATFIHPCNIYQHTNFHGPTLTAASLASTSAV
jgi:hypothetical protein